MNYAKMLGLATVAAAALMAFVGASSAFAATSTLCSAAESPCTNKAWPIGTVLDFSLEGSSLLKETGPNGQTIDTCTEGTVKGKLEEDSRFVGAPLAGGKNTAITWGKCTFTTTTTLLGGLSIEGLAGGNGTLFAKEEIRVTINTFIFGSCVYALLAGAHLGTLTELSTGATIDANAVALKGPGSNIACPVTAVWTAKYVQTEPSNTTLYVSNK